jgi:hypothetical protein
MAVVVPAGLAWACVAVMSLTTVSNTVQPGGTVTIVGREFAQGAPVEIHLDSPGGPLLTTAPPPPTTMTSRFTWDVPIPANTPYGQHLLFAVQNYHNMNAAVPRSVIYVGTLPPAAAGPERGEPGPARPRRGRPGAAGGGGMEHGGRRSAPGGRGGAGQDGVGRQFAQFVSAESKVRARVGDSMGRGET